MIKVTYSKISTPLFLGPGLQTVYRLFDMVFCQNLSFFLMNHIGIENCACRAKDTFLELCK